jgi:hypothetical protein
MFLYIFVQPFSYFYARACKTIVQENLLVCVFLFNVDVDSKVLSMWICWNIETFEM